MLGFVKKKNLFLTPALLPFKREDKFDSVDFVLDTGAGLTIIDTGIIDYLGYLAREDGFDTSSLDGVVTLPG